MADTALAPASRLSRIPPSLLPRDLPLRAPVPTFFQLAEAMGPSTPARMNYLGGYGFLLTQVTDRMLFYVLSSVSTDTYAYYMEAEQRQTPTRMVQLGLAGYRLLFSAYGISFYVRTIAAGPT